MKGKTIIRSLFIGIIISMSGISLKGQVNDLKNTTMKKIDTKEFPSLPYAYDALEPYIDARTMEIHYDKHHRTYFTNLVNAIKGTALENQNIEAIMKNVSASGDGVRNNGGGYYNHILFWNNMGKGLATPSSEMLKALEQAFTSFDKFKETLST